MKTVIIFLLISTTLLVGKENVILLHGLGRTDKSMKPIEKKLKKAGYTVWNISYPSTKYSIEEICSLFVGKEIEKISKGTDSLSFVTHSMGGIILRYYLNTHNVNYNSIVMLCPPNQGSSLTDKLKREINWIYKSVNGPAGMQLGTDSSSIIHTLHEIRGNVGIIAGDKSMEPYFSWLISGSDDGKVLIEETKLNEMSDFIILHHTHTFMMNNKDTQEQIVYFLKNHKFKR